MSLIETHSGGNATTLPGVMPLGVLSRRTALFGGVTIAGFGASFAKPAAARPAIVDAVSFISADADLISLASRVEALAMRRHAVTERVKRLELQVEAAHPRPARPVSNDAYRAYYAEVQPTEERIGLAQLRTVRRRTLERLDRWAGDLAAMEPTTTAGLGAKAAAVFAVHDLTGENEGAEALTLSVLRGAMRLGAGAAA